MNPKFEVLGVGRTPMRSEEFRAKLREEVAGSTDARNFTENGWREFESRLRYYAGDVNDQQFHSRLREHLNQMQRAGSSPNRLFYIATPASVGGALIDGLPRRDSITTRPAGRGSSSKSPSATILIPRAN
jgi:glucose-6-phosphate 1-dehydrogenase